MDCISPVATTIAWSSFAGAPVPSMTRTWLRTKTGVSTLTKSATSLAFWVWATVVAATSNDPNKKRRRISMHPGGPTFESFGKKPQFYPSHTYLVENAIEQERPGWVVQNPGLTRSLDGQTPVPPESRANRKQLFVNRRKFALSVRLLASETCDMGILRQLCSHSGLVNRNCSLTRTSRGKSIPAFSRVRTSAVVKGGGSYFPQNSYVPAAC